MNVFARAARRVLAATEMQLLLVLVVIVVLAVLLPLLGQAQQLPVVAYKLLLAPLGGLVALAAWLACVPFLNPSRYLSTDWRADPDADVRGGPDFDIPPGSVGVFTACGAFACAVFCFGALAVGLGL